MVAAARNARARPWRQSLLTRIALLLAGLGLAGLGLPGLGRAQETAPFPRTGEYIGKAECVRCHEAQLPRLQRGAHAAILDSATLPACETCHGPGKLHAADEGEDGKRITMPAKLAMKDQVAFCGRCHQDQIARHGGDFAGFVHAGKVCTDCHEVHVRSRAVPLSEARFRTRRECNATAEPTGTKTCVECHPLRDQLLAASVHGSLAAGAHASGCETCHGEGSLHESSKGLARLITRPDRAADGIATCRSCHAAVDATEFHWRGKRKPFLTSGVTCTTCHQIHVPKPGAQLEPGAKADAAPMAAVPAPAAAGPAATNRTCAKCHAPALCTMPGSTHASLGGLDLPLDRGCATCHEGGLAHAAAGGRKDLVDGVRGQPSALQAKRCLQCHRDERALQHVKQGHHERAGVGCVECHAPLHGATRIHVADAAEQACRRCHPAVAAEFAFPNHHPVPEGRMRCASCHDVHGDRHRVRDLELTERRCVECHPRYGGPFVFAHQAGRRDGCVVCHEPHGTSNRRLLKQVTTQQNCLQCHGDFPAFHDQTPGAVFTNCIRCHTEVHGSNHARYLFR
ncbi:MAG TPA: cytochrome c3 family protein [Planctomycetota bacterium]